MKLSAPAYYKDFKCIADRCRHSCCIGWEIDIDLGSLEKYRGTEIEASISEGEAPHFVLTDGERCPHLDGRGLCRIITARGEDFLCDICREHPRFYHDTLRGREAGLGMSCEEACRLILSRDDFGEFTELGEADCEPASDFDALAPRARIFDILSSGLGYEEKLQTICREFSAEILPDEDARELLESLEYLDSSHKALFMNYSLSASPEEELEPMLARALAYFVFRHCSDAADSEEFRASLCFALFCERLLASLAAADNIHETARIISEEIEYSEENTEAVKFEFEF